MRRAPQNRMLARQNPEGDAGLTLLELMITIVVLAVLAAVVVPVWRGVTVASFGSATNYGLMVASVNSQGQPNKRC